MTENELSSSTAGGISAGRQCSTVQRQPCNAEDVPDFSIKGTLFCFSFTLVQHHAVTLGDLPRTCVTGPARAEAKVAQLLHSFCAVTELFPCMPI